MAIYRNVSPMTIYRNMSQWPSTEMCHQWPYTEMWPMTIYRNASLMTVYRNASLMTVYRNASLMTVYRNASLMIVYRYAWPMTIYRNASPITVYRNASLMTVYRNAWQIENQQLLIPSVLLLPQPKSAGHTAPLSLLITSKNISLFFTQMLSHINPSPIVSNYKPTITHHLQNQLFLITILLPITFHTSNL
jgi:Fe2+ or Zn2+ uptake regulation protein